MNRSAVVIRHLAFEDLGILAPVLADHGYQIQYLEAGIDRISPADLIAADLLIVLGGPIGVYETDRYPFLREELQAIQARLKLDKPTLGVCLGAQLLAQALNAEVAATGQTEIGFAPLTLTVAGENSLLQHIKHVPVLHWHGDQFSIPQGAERLAETPGFSNQGFSLGPRILGLQFHLEADHTQVERWLIGHAHELSTRGIDVNKIRQDARKFGPNLAKAANQAFGEWLRGHYS